MVSTIRILLLSAQNYLSKQTVPRTPEPDQVMTQQPSVDQFNNIAESNVAISFCGAIELLFKIGAIPNAKNALDMACGPGHFSLFLAKYGGLKKVIGIDLSEQMIDKAVENSGRHNLSHNVQFSLGDITNLHYLKDRQFDLVTCTNSAHHLPSLDALSTMLKEMERLSTDQGTGFLMDLTRLNSAACLQKYINLTGQEYIDRGLTALYEDFHNSMFAAWTPDELCSAIPPNSSFNWFYFSTLPLPINQFLFFKPKTWEPVNSLDSFVWVDSKIPVRTDLQREYKIYRQSLFTSYRWFLKKLH